MTSQYQWAKDKLKQFDIDCQNIREEIDRLYAMLAKKQEARLQFHEMVEREFGASEQTVVMQDMRMRPAVIERGAARELPPPSPQAAAKDERKRQRDREAYLRRKERAKRLGAFNTPENRQANATTRQRIRNAMEHRTEPISSGDLIRAWGVTDQEERQRIYNAFGALYAKGELQKVGVNSHGYTYLKANDHPHEAHQ